MRAMINLPFEGSRAEYSAEANSAGHPPHRMDIRTGRRTILHRRAILRNLDLLRPRGTARHHHSGNKISGQHFGLPGFSPTIFPVFISGRGRSMTQGSPLRWLPVGWARGHWWRHGGETGTRSAPATDRPCTTTRAPPAPPGRAALVASCVAERSCRKGAQPPSILLRELHHRTRAIGTARKQFCKQCHIFKGKPHPQGGCSGPFCKRS